jgi:hypothetical protein
MTCTACLYRPLLVQQKDSVASLLAGIELRLRNCGATKYQLKSPILPNTNWSVNVDGEV